MTKKTFTTLVAKKIGETLSLKEQAELEQIVAEDPRARAILDEIDAFTREKEPRGDLDIDVKLEEMWDKRAAMPEASPHTLRVKKHRLPAWSRVAALAIILIGVGWFAYHHYPAAEELYSQAMETGGDPLYGVLDDGTRVWLNKHSRIDYNDHFGERSRTIKLTGEAFFDVAHVPGTPLTVSARNVEIEVKGTAFNVNAASPNIEVALVSGLVSVKNNRERRGKEILLHPNQKIVVREGTALSNDSSHVIRDLVQENDTIISETRWLEGSLVFHKQRFSDLTKLMEERYQVTIRVENDALARQRFTGSIKSETLQQMLNALKQSYPFTYEINDKVVVIR